MKIFGSIGKLAKIVRGAVSSGTKKITGESILDEADRMYEDVKGRFDEHKAYFEEEVDKLCAEIDTEINTINRTKLTIKTELFPAFAQKMRTIQDIPVSEEFCKEYFYGNMYKVDAMKSKADLYLIEFQKNRFKTNALAVITFGYYRRKKAKEALDKVKTEKKRLEEEMTRMDSELVIISQIRNALKNIAEYYLALMDLYVALLNRMDNAVNFLLIRCLSTAHKFVKDEMSLNFLPKTQQEEIMAMFTISQTLKVMVEKQIAMEGNTASIRDDISKINANLRNCRDEINKKYETA